MAYQMAAITMTFSDLQMLFTYCKPLQMWFFVSLCNSWQDFNWHDASPGPSAIAELLVLHFALPFISLYSWWR